MIEVVLTGTGVPNPMPGRASNGTLVLVNGLALQFDAGRSTVLRLTEAGTRCRDLDALFLTHHHPDHMVGLPDVTMTRWQEQNDDPLEIIARNGPSTVFARAMLDAWEPDLTSRARLQGRALATVETHGFDATDRPKEIWSRDGVSVAAVLVRHWEFLLSVGYRIDANGESVVISGDTRICPEVEGIADGTDILVHEVMRTKLMGDRGPILAEGHADSIELGTLAERAHASTLVLTHLIPQPIEPRHADGFAKDVRQGGFTGEVVVGEDLVRLSTEARRA